MFLFCSLWFVLPPRAWLSGLALVLLLGLGAPARPAAAETLAGPVPAELVRVLDGDTIIVRARIWLGQEIETRVRLWGVNAPELRSPDPQDRARAQAARVFVVAELAGGRLTLHAIRRDKYGGRVVARVRAPDGSDLAARLLAAGLAEPYAPRRRAHLSTPGP
ncbi:MAG: thermonuclease family protein [Alphaproteobacteria bacterium]|nr:thermonuclease family protein [Alphaproteobacteria bacterium]